MIFGRLLDQIKKLIFFFLALLKRKAELLDIRSPEDVCAIVLLYYN